MMAKATLAALVAVVWSSPALARPEVVLAYDASPDCPTQSQFVSSVVARGASFDAPAPAGAHPAMVVALHRDGGEFEGTFQVRDDRGATNKRALRGATCGEVADALAMVTAIALRPELADASSSPVAAAASPPEEARLRGTTMTYHPPHERVAVPAGNVDLDLVRTLTAYAGVTAGLAPGVIMPRFDLSTSGTTFLTLPDGSQRIVGVILHYRASFLGPATYRTADTRTSMYGLSFGFGACGTPHADSRGLVLLLCVEYGLGLMDLQTKGNDGTSIQSKAQYFGTGGLSTELQYNLGTLFHVGARLGGDAAWGRLTAERADGSQIFKSSTLSGYLLLGGGLRF